MRPKNPQVLEGSSAHKFAYGQGASDAPVSSHSVAEEPATPPCLRRCAHAVVKAGLLLAVSEVGTLQPASNSWTRRITESRFCWSCARVESCNCIHCMPCRCQTYQQLPGPNSSALTLHRIYTLKTYREAKAGHTDANTNQPLATQPSKRSKADRGRALMPQQPWPSSPAPCKRSSGDHEAEKLC